MLIRTENDTECLKKIHWVFFSKLYFFFISSFENHKKGWFTLYQRKNREFPMEVTISQQAFDSLSDYVFISITIY